MHLRDDNSALTRTVYAPLCWSVSVVPAVDFGIFAVDLAVAASIMSSINFITTFFKILAAGMTLH